MLFVANPCFSIVSNMLKLCVRTAIKTGQPKPRVANPNLEGSSVPRLVESADAKHFSHLSDRFETARETQRRQPRLTPLIKVHALGTGRSAPSPTKLSNAYQASCALSYALGDQVTRPCERPRPPRRSRRPRAARGTRITHRAPQGGSSRSSSLLARLPSATWFTCS